MPYPRLNDNGRTVELDLHGATVEQALRIILRTVQQASVRGRYSVKIIHGSSTSSRFYRNRSIKNELDLILEAGDLDKYVSSTWKSDEYMLLSLHINLETDPRRITLNDVF